MTDWNRADGKAAMMRAREKAAETQTVRKIGEPVNMPGFMMWQVGEAGGVMVVMPDLVDPTPEIMELYFARIMANGIGWCPRCDAVASDQSSYLPGISIVHAGVFHTTTCPTMVLEREEARWFDPRALALIHQDEEDEGGG